MPWLSRRNSEKQSVKPVNDNSNRSDKSSINAMVDFIPSQIDGLCGTMPTHHRQEASRILWGDIRVMAQNVGCLPAMLRATCSTKVLRSLFKNPVDARDALLQFCLATMQMWMLLVALPAFISLPGLLFAGFVNSFWLLTLALIWPLSGPRILMTEQEKAPMTEDFSDERWIYVNGMMCSNRSLRSQCSRMSSTFGRPIIGIHNRTFGLFFDLVTLLLQHSLNIPTPCTLALGAQIRDACLTNSVRKVVLIGHSTGCSHISIALDQLHASLPIDVLSKLEIYTFGSVAAHLSNPCLAVENPGAGTFNYTRPDGSIASPVKATLASLGHRIEDHERVIPHVEHYALTSDIFARCGVLHHTRNTLDNRFCGRVFVLTDEVIRKPDLIRSATNSGGFMLNEHYLNLLFPTSPSHSPDVLNLVVAVDIETAEKREFTAQGVALPQKSISISRYCPETNANSRNNSKSNSPDTSPKTVNRASWESAAMGGANGVGKARIAARECEGKTVRQLSRLWRYVNGGRPVGEGVAVVNGAGQRVSGNGLGMVQ